MRGILGKVRSISDQSQNTSKTSIAGQSESSAGYEDAVDDLLYGRIPELLRAYMAQDHKEHSYSVKVRWTGNLGRGTSDYRAYKRDHEISSLGKPPVLASSDPAFRGDASRYNPEDLLVASLSACHMLSYLHLCAVAGIVVTDYQDDAKGTMAETKDGGGHFTKVTLHPDVKVAAGADTDLAMQLHETAHHLCFIASSVNFPVLCEASIENEQPHEHT